MLWYIEIANKKEYPDPSGNDVIHNAHDLNIKGVSRVQACRLYLIDADLGETQVRTIAEELLIDKVTEVYSINRPLLNPGKSTHAVSIFRKPGVMDPVEASALKGIAELGMKADAVKSGRKYLVVGKISRKDLETLVKKSLANEAVDDFFFGQKEFRELPKSKPYQFKLIIVPLLGASDEQLLEFNKQYTLSLNLEELKTVQNHFTSLDRNPTDAELETIAQTWSEHCKHKTFTGNIDFNGEPIQNLLKGTIMKVTQELNKPWCLSVFTDNAGVIEFDENTAVCFKVETHNHPSAIDPYGGAGTGIGGVIRDILGCGMGAKPIMNTDIFCVGLPDMEYNKVPKGALHPKRVLKGVVAGVRDYGNRMGIPTCNGAVFFDERYTGNPLVYCGTVGVMPKDKINKASRAGDLIIVVGGRTGRDGIHGATFSSVELTHESETVSSGAVQIGNAIMEKKVLDTILQARDKGLYTCITDCGAGGLSSAIGEMGEELGAEVELSKVPLKYEGLSYTEIWISEAQERMVISVPPENLDAIMRIFNEENVEATVLGKFTDTKRLVLHYQGNKVADIDMLFLHKGVPKSSRKAVWERPELREPRIAPQKNYNSVLKKLLSSYNICSKEWIIRQYDHEVQARSVMKSLAGPEYGPSDACIIRPVLGSRKGIIAANGMSPKFGDIDPYWMAASSIDEALRNVTAVGGNLERTALLDNFSWGNTNKPDRLGGLVRASQACYDIAKIYGTPFISGKDSLNNEFATEKGTIAIPPSLLISAICMMPDADKAISMDLKKEGSFIYVIGMTRPELGGSHYYALNGCIGNSVPQVDARLNKELMEKLSQAISSGLVLSCHDASEGGLAVAIAEMAFAGGIGAQVSLKEVPVEGALRNDVILFSESNGRFIAEIAPEKAKAFERLFKGLPVGNIGGTTGKDSLKISGLGGKTIVNAGLKELKDAWQRPLNW